jgi:hypothetical protein
MQRNATERQKKLDVGRSVQQYQSYYIAIFQLYPKRTQNIPFRIDDEAIVVASFRPALGMKIVSSLLHFSIKHMKPVGDRPFVREVLLLHRLSANHRRKQMHHQHQSAPHTKLPASQVARRIPMIALFLSIWAAFISPLRSDFEHIVGQSK